MGVTHNIIIVSMLILGFIFRKKKIKDVKIFNVSIVSVFIFIYLTIIIIVEFILPIPTYYINPKEELYIETIIENEMTRSNIEFDKGSLEIVNNFHGKYNQLYFSKYEVNGLEEARMFDFKQNIFGNLKPSHDFSESKIILKSGKDNDLNFRGIGDGLASFFISYGYNNSGERFEGYVVNKHNIMDLNPESYYLIVERVDGHGLLFLLLYIILFVIIIYKRIKEENKLKTYRETKIEWRKLKVLEVEYFAKKQF